MLAMAVQVEELRVTDNQADYDEAEADSATSQVLEWANTPSSACCADEGCGWQTATCCWVHSLLWL